MKRIVLRWLALLYLLCFGFSLVLLVKPGASLFFRRVSLDPRRLRQDAGNAYRYSSPLDPRFFPTEGMLFFENDLQLSRTDKQKKVETGNAVFLVSEPAESELSSGLAEKPFPVIFFSASDASSPLTNGRVYTAYLHVIFLSRTAGLIYLLLLLPGLAWFAWYSWSGVENRKILLGSPLGFVAVLDGFLEALSGRVKRFLSRLQQKMIAGRSTWKRYFTLTILAAYFYIFMEWLFYVTKPSFMDMMGFPEKVEVFLLSSLFLSLAATSLFLVVIFLDLLFSPVRLQVVSRTVFILLPAAIFAASALLLIDNFTYTLFHFGIVSSTGIGRGAYAAVFILLLLAFYRQVSRLARRGEADQKVQTRTASLPYFSVIGLLLVSTLLGFWQVKSGGVRSATAQPDEPYGSPAPNIILLGSDGVDASHLSLYGYKRATSPRINQLAQTSLVAENAFTNSANSAGSVISILTSKLPTETHLLYAPDILQGQDAYQHLPGLLKKDGYLNVELGVDYYVDAYSLNLRNGFDTVNNRSQADSRLGGIARGLGLDSSAYLLNSLSQRLFSRILHIFYIQDFQNPLAQVIQPAGIDSDQIKINQLLNIVDTTPGPVFIHAHLMGTHGPLFSPREPVYSLGKTQDEQWMTDFYDDAILSFDDYVGQVIDRLKEMGEFESTVLILYSDHGKGYRVNGRIPLIIHFPGGKHAGRVTANVQNMDIAPTILDYLGEPIPDWMNGLSILSGDLPPHRLILSAGTDLVSLNESGVYSLSSEQIGPPFYQFTLVNVVDCQEWYSLNLKTMRWKSGVVDGYQAPCHPGSLRGQADMREEILREMAGDGFDVSSLP